MIFTAIPLAGAFVIGLERLEDDRGFFARSFCEREFADHGLNPRVVQCNVSYNRKRGMLRGLHYQAAPYPEAKLVRCTGGAIWDVVVDIRPESATYRCWHAEELSADNRRALYVPEGFAHGFQALSDDSEVLYLMSECFHPECARGLRWNDPAIGITWPVSDPVMSTRDRELPLLGA